MRRSSIVRRSVVTGLTVIAVVAGVLVPATTASAATTPRKPVTAVRVSGTALTDTAGRRVELRGVNRSGSEYDCQQGGGVFSGPTDVASIDLLRSWNVNTVRIPLNEHCWIGNMDWAPTSSGTAYRNSVTAYANRLAANGIRSILDLHFTGPTEIWGEQSREMPNTTFSVPFWKSVATKFAGNPAVLYEPYNEPHDVSVACWRDGCTMPGGWQAAGYQQLVDTIRATGAKQPIIVNGLDWGHDMSPLLTAMPRDPAKALVAGQHLYNFKNCVTATCWSARFAPVAAKMPLVAEEIGVNDCSTAMPLAFMTWMDANGGDGYAFWNFGVTGCPDGAQYGGSALISNWDGTRTPYGDAIRKHYRLRPL